MNLFMAELKQYLRKKEKIGYGLGDMASNLYFQTFVVFMPIFYTDVFETIPSYENNLGSKLSRAVDGDTSFIEE